MKLNLDLLLKEATKNIKENYFLVHVCNSENPIYRERVYCYELYHQMRKILDTIHEEKHYDIFGEIDKRSHPVIEEDYKPDFIMHIPSSYDNLLVMEVKTIEVKKNGIEKDLDTLFTFIKKYDYKKAVYLIYGYDDKKSKNNIIKSIFEICDSKGYALDNLDIWFHNKYSEEAIKYELTSE